MEILFVNPNRIQPPVAPLALESLSEALRGIGVGCRLLDLCLDGPASGPLPPSLLAPHDVPDLRAVLVTMRNLDDAYYFSRVSFLPAMRSIVRSLRETLGKPVIVGGSGFSVAPEPILAALGADLGLRGAAESDLAGLVRALDQPERVPSLPGVVLNDGTRVRSNPPSPPEMQEDLFSPRRFIDNRAYFLRGGMAGLETKRGCPEPCRYCVDPVIKGHRVYRKPLPALLREVHALLGQGVNVFHLCDSEFNVPREHAEAVCGAFRDDGLARKIRWFTYAAPAGFDGDLAGKMASAGCAGINFGADHARPEILEALGRRHRAEDLRRAAEGCHEAGIPFLFDLLLGGPGETLETLWDAVDLCRELAVPRVGANVGIRVYPGTALAARVLDQGPLHENPDLEGRTADNPNLLHPVFFRSRLLGSRWQEHLAARVGGDPRFFLPVTSARNENYNYNENTVLVDALARGHRGAFWDVLRRLQDGLPPLRVPA